MWGDPFPEKSKIEVCWSLMKQAYPYHPCLVHLQYLYLVDFHGKSAKIYYSHGWYVIDSCLAIFPNTKLLFIAGFASTQKGTGFSVP